MGDPNGRAGCKHYCPRLFGVVGVGWLFLKAACQKQAAFFVFFLKYKPQKVTIVKPEILQVYRSLQLARGDFTLTFDWAGRRVLVTGAAGFIGSAIVWALNNRNCTDIVVSDFSAGAEKKRNLESLAFSEFADAKNLIERLDQGDLGEFDCVFHLGACSSTTEMDEDYLRKNNFEYTRDLGRWALERNVRFVYASSAATYGDGTLGMDDRDMERMKLLRPLNPYGNSKQMFDLYALDNGWLEKIVGLKYFNVFGPNEYHKGDMRSVVLKSFRQVLDTGTIRLFKSYRKEYADGEQMRDFLYIKDSVEMTLFLAENPEANGIFNIGSGKAHSWNELAAAIFSALGRKPATEYIDMPEAIREKYQYFTKANIGKLRASGYSQPILPLLSSVRDYVESYLVPDRVLGQ